MPIRPFIRALAAVCLVAVFRAAAPPSLAAQEGATPVTAHNAIFGTASLGSILAAISTYERRLAPRFAAQAGFGWLLNVDIEGEPDVGAAEVFQLGASYLGGDGNSHLEVGAALLYLNEPIGSLGDTRALGSGVIGYRYQRPDGGVVFRTGVMPVIGADEGAIEVALYLSMGLAF